MLILRPDCAGHEFRVHILTVPMSVGELFLPPDLPDLTTSLKDGAASRLDLTINLRKAERA